MAESGCRQFDLSYVRCSAFGSRRGPNSCNYSDVCCRSVHRICPSTSSRKVRFLMLKSEIFGLILISVFRFYRMKLAENGGRSNPEARWGTSLYLSAFMAIGLFIAAWTSFPYIIWVGESTPAHVSVDSSTER